MPTDPEQNQTVERLHATTIAWQGYGALLLGASGSGKSTLALHMMALGCDLIADDQTELTVEAGLITACSPQAIKGQIEARGFAILNAQSQSSAQIICCIDLDQPESDRLPPERFMTLCNRPIRLFHKPGIEVLPFALLQYLKSQQMQL